MAPSSRKRQWRNLSTSTKPRSRPGDSAKSAATGHPADSSTLATRVLEWLLQRLPAAHREKARNYLVLTRMDRPIGALLLLWPTWWALWLAAADFPPLKLLVIFTLGVFSMRAAGCAINDFADRKLDPQVARTAGRPIAAGRVTPREALIVFASLLVFSFLLVLFTNAFTIKLSLVGAALAAIYPFTKRYTHMPQVVLGAAFGWSIPMAFAAVSGTVPALGWLLFIANIIWSVVYDTEYAMVDRDDDIKAGAKSTAILFGDADLPILGILMATFLLAMLFVGQRAALGWPYWLGLLVAAGLFGWQLWRMRERARDACLWAFRNNNWLGMALWIGIVLALAMR
ncbi:4-hydroxybenzoate octaprenyltransferase [Dyella soli]|uniref:4-hydroxybenzoate octaprenyltransferase n=1 Tax=Dyella soli TaxID=522319 RepID=A0A4V2NL08_9GAMM|nr:4-hydroxybenzoate octaprenyltransferase [Dyella soli]TCI06402.1 4-hydroxybenzoate octaprenyltransferase [Dyella soli]